MSLIRSLLLRGLVAWFAKVAPAETEEYKGL